MSNIINIDDTKREMSCSVLRFYASRELLLSVLSKISGVVERRNAIDVLACVSLRAQFGRIKLIATDLDISMFASFSADIIEEGEVKISAHVLYDIIKKLPAGLDVKFEANNQNKLLISCENANFSLANIVSNKFPALEDDDYIHSFWLSSTELRDLLTKTKFAVSLDDTRYNLNGIYMHTEEQFLYCVATDGHRLSCITKSKPSSINGNFNIIIPRKTITELLRILDEFKEVNIQLTERKVKFTCGSYVLISKLIDGTFPNYKEVIPTIQGKKLVIESHKLATVIDRVSVVILDKVKSIKFLLKEDELTLNSNCSKSSDARESVSVNYSGENIQMGFNSRYLLDILSCIKNKCKFSFTGVNNATVITDEDDPNALYIVMPMRTEAY